MSDGSVKMPKRQSRCGIVEALNREWCILVRDHRGTAMQWAVGYGALHGCESLDDVVLRAAEEPDAVLTALLAEVAKGSQIAARTVMQTLIGRVVRMAWRDCRASVDLYLSALWCVITSYPLDRRPSKIPANLSMDTLKLVSGERQWLLRGEVSTWSPSAFVEAEREFGQFNCPAQEPDASEVLGTGLELGLINSGAHALLLDVYVDGLSGSQAADRHGTSAGAIRVRCSKAVRGMAAHASELVEAA